MLQGHYTSVANQSLVTLCYSIVTDTGKGRRFIYSANIRDKIIPEFVQGHCLIATECPIHIDTDKLLGCECGPASRLFINHMGGIFEHERNMALTSSIS